MNQSEIKAKYEEFAEQISFHRGEIKILQARIGVLVAACKHPAAYTYSAMGELGTKCPDCGWAT